jgi:transcriptional regulator with XRE-family HTH domain
MPYRACPCCRPRTIRRNLDNPATLALKEGIRFERARTQNGYGTWTRLDTGRGFMDRTGAQDGFFAMLAALREFRATRLSLGNPSDRALARAAGVSPTTIGAWLRGNRFPQRFAEFIKVVHAVRTSARALNIPVPDGLLDDERWRAAYQDGAHRRAGKVSEAVQREQAAKSLAVLSPGRPLAEVTDPFAFEVRPSVQAANQDLPVLPVYVPRAHDARLAEIAIPNLWRLWHPIDPSRPGGSAAGASRTLSRTP